METKKILIFDDAPELLDALTLFLNKYYIVKAVSTKDEFNKVLKHFSPDIILLDVYFNGIPEGIEICRLIKEDIEIKSIPVILISASVNMIHNFKECKADAIIEKPFELGYLLKTIHIILSNRMKKENGLSLPYPKKTNAVLNLNITSATLAPQLNKIKLFDVCYYIFLLIALVYLYLI